MKKAYAVRRGTTMFAALQALQGGEQNISTLVPDLQKSVSSLRHRFFVDVLLPQGLEEGLLVLSGETVSITARGRTLLAEVNERSIKDEIKENREKVKSNLFVPSRDTYVPEKYHARPGSMDYMNCNSIINGKSTPYHIKNV
jgi:hypothetical protein